jgi:hypothetical protein
MNTHIRTALEEGALVETGRDDQGIYYQAPPEAKHHTKKTVERLLDIYASLGRAHTALYSPWVSLSNSQWSDDQVIDLAPSIVDRAFRALEEAENKVSQFLQDLYASERV